MVVALLEASCGYSRTHAVSLDHLRAKLEGNGVPLDIVGVNTRHWPARLMATEMSKRVNFSVFQSTPKLHYWSQLGGLKDDVFVYDRCGMLAYFIPFPHSYVPQRYVELAVQSAHARSPCPQPHTRVVTLEEQARTNSTSSSHARPRLSASERS